MTGRHLTGDNVIVVSTTNHETGHMSSSRRLCQAVQQVWLLASSSELWALITYMSLFGEKLILSHLILTSWLWLWLPCRDNLNISSFGEAVQRLKMLGVTLWFCQKETAYRRKKEVAHIHFCSWSLCWRVEGSASWFSLGFAWKSQKRGSRRRDMLFRNNMGWGAF